MPIEVEVPNVGIVEFPDDYTEEQISSALSQSRQKADAQLGLEAVTQAANLSGRALDLTNLGMQAPRIAEAPIPEGIPENAFFMEPESQGFSRSPSGEAPTITEPSMFAPIGRALNLAGRFAMASAADIINDITGQTAVARETEHLHPEIPPEIENVDALLQGKPLPAESQLQVLPTSLQIAARVPQGLIQSIPQLAAVAGLQAVGVPAPAGAAAVFGLTPEGFNPKQAAIAAALPFVGKYGGQLAEAIAAKTGVTKDAALGFINGAGATTAAGAYTAAIQASDIAALPADQRKDAIIESIASIVGQSMLGPIGMERLPEREVPNAISQERPQLLRGVRPRNEAEQVRTEMPTTESGEAARVGGREARQEGQSQVLLTPEPIQRAADQLGLVAKPEAAPAIRIPENISPEDAAIYRELQKSPSVELTDRTPGSPTEGLTIHPKMGSTLDEVVKMWNNAKEGYTPPEQLRRSKALAELKPAVLVGNEVVTGGNTHPEVIHGRGDAETIIAASDPKNQGFEFEGKFLSREESAKLIGEKEPLTSERLRSIRERSSTTTVPATPIVAVEPEPALSLGPGAASPEEFAQRTAAGAGREPPADNPPVAVEGGSEPSMSVVRQNKDFNLFNRINSGQWSFYFGRLGQAAKAAWERMALGEFRMRSSAQRDINSIVREPLSQLPRQFRRKGGQAFFDLLNGKTMEDIRTELEGKPGAEAIIAQAERVKTRLEEIRTTIRDTKRDSYRQALMNMNKPVLEGLFRENIGDFTEGKTNTDLADALAMDQFPDDWGIADGSYLPHLFMGQWKIIATLPGEESSAFVSRAKTIQEAKVKIYEYAKNNPEYANADFQLKVDTVIPADMIRLGDRKFWGMISKMKAQMEAGANPREAVRGIIGRKAGKVKRFGSLEHRRGALGYSRDYEQTMTAYLNGFHRWRELTAMNREVQPLIEKVRAEGRPNAAARLEELLDTLWGKPAKSTAEFDAFVRQVPVLRDYIKPLALDRWSRFTTSLVSNLMLRTLRFGIVNRLQPLQTLYSLIGERLMFQAKALQHSPEGRALLKEAGVDVDPGQYASAIGPRTKLRNFAERLSGERSNQEFAFLGMYLHGLEKGLSRPEAIKYGKLRGQLLTQFTPLLTDTPPLMEGPFGRVVFQFKRFPVKQVELLSRMVADRNVPGVARFVGMMALFGGLSWMLRQTYTDKEKRLRLKRAMESEVGDKAANVLYYGLPGLAGADLSGSLVLGDEPMGANIYEQIGRQVTGPAVSAGIEAAKTSTAEPREPMTATDRAMNTLKKFPSLRPIAELRDLVNRNTDVMAPDGETKYRRSLRDALMGLGSFRSANEANIQLAVGAIIELEKESNQLKNAYYVSDGSDAAEKAIDNFNQRWPEFEITGRELNAYLKARHRGEQKTDVERVAGKKFRDLIPD